MSDYQIKEVYLSYIEPDRGQPRKSFDEEKIEELADSIRKYGVLEPLIVQKENGYYKIIAGERRWRAASRAGILKVPVIIRNVSEQEAAEISLIENIHREDLNPIEEAIAYKNYMDTFHITQEELAEILSRNRSTIAHSMRLLNLNPEVQKMIADGRISSGHGKDLLSLNALDQLRVAKQIVSKHLSVKEAKKEIEKKRIKKKTQNFDFSYLERELEDTIGTKVKIQKERKKGTLLIEFYDDETLDNIYLCLKNFKNS